MTGAETFASEAAGRSVGVVEDESVLDVGAKAGLLGRGVREGLSSCRLFLRDRDPGFVDEGLETCVLERGLVGEGSREANGEGAADEEVEVAEVCDNNFDCQVSVFGVIVAVLVVDSRDSGGSDGDDWAPLLGEGE